MLLHSVETIPRETWSSDAAILPKSAFRSTSGAPLGSVFGFFPSLQRGVDHYARLSTSDLLVSRHINSHTRRSSISVPFIRDIVRPFFPGPRPFFEKHLSFFATGLTARRISMDIPSKDGFDIAGLVQHIITSIQNDPGNWRDLLPHARSLVAFLDISTSGFSSFTGEQKLWILDTLQRLAFAEPDTGAISDVANWCLRQTLVIVDEVPEDTVALRREYLLTSAADAC
jgi:hypothetical protein